MTTKLNDILELLNKNDFFTKYYDAIIEEFNHKNKIKITRKNRVINNNSDIVYNPNIYANNYSYNTNSNLNNEYCYFYLAIVKEWFSTKFYINIIINPANNIIINEKINKITFTPYSASDHNINVESIVDYIYNIEKQVNRAADINPIVASNQHICSICNAKIYNI